MKHFLATLLFITTATCALAQNVKLIFDKTSPQAAYAAGRLQKTLLTKKHAIAAGGYVISININKQLGEEGYSIKPVGKTISVTGGDGTGLIYGTLSVAEDIANGVKLGAIKSSTGKPQMALRAVKYDLPWDTYRHSNALDQH